MLNSNLDEYSFYVIDKMLPNHNFKKVVKDVLKEKMHDSIERKLKINITNYERMDLALKHIEETLQNLKQRGRNPYIIVLQSNLTPQRLNYLGTELTWLHLTNIILHFIGLKSILNDFPTLALKSVDSSDIIFSSLDWYTKCIQRLSEK